LPSNNLAQGQWVIGTIADVLLRSVNLN
jgi:hypothetical protein